MKFLLEDFWILTEAGALIYHYSAETTYDEQFFGMVLSALNSFAEQISDEGLSSFELANKRFSFIKKKDIIFLGCSASSLKEKAAKKELKEIIKLFFKFYPEDFLSNWNGNIEMFSKFKLELEKKQKN